MQKFHCSNVQFVSFLYETKNQNITQVQYGDEKEGLFLTTLACKDPKAPLPRFFGLFDGFTFPSFSWFGSSGSFGFFGKNCS